VKSTRRPLFVHESYKDYGSKIAAILTAILLTLIIVKIDSFYCFSFAANKTEKPAITGTIIVSIGNLRSRPTLNASIIQKLHKRDTVTFLTKKDEWYMVKLYDDRVGWAHQRLFLDRGSIPESNQTFLGQREPETRNKVTLKVTIGLVREKPSPGGKVLFELKKGETAFLVATKDEWNLIELEDGRLGWAHQSLFLTSPEQQPPDTSTFKKIKDIEYIMTPEGEEMVTFQLDAYYSPKTFSIMGNRPKIICDFYGASLETGIERQLNVNGDLIRQIRIGIHKGTKSKVRVILDLVPDREYEVRPVFFKDENLFTLIVGRPEIKK